MGKKKIVLDTNILISALGWEGKPRDIFRRVLLGEFELIISYDQISELERVMDYPKFAFTENQKERFLNIISTIATIIDIDRNLSFIKEDPDDDVILETAVSVNADFIISGDPHLLKLKEFNKVEIVSAAEFMRKIGD